LGKYAFVVGNPGDEFVESFERSLFHQNQHLFLQANSGWTNFFIVNSERASIEAFLPVHVQGRKASSPYRSPFGSIIFSARLSPRVLYDFLLFIESELKKNGVEEIDIQNPPIAYHSQNLNLLQALLVTCGFSVSKAEITSVIHIDTQSLDLKMKQQQQQRLTQAKSEGMLFEILDVNNLFEVYTLISEWQLTKGFNLSMSLSELTKVVEIFPERFIISVVKLKKATVAAAISIRVTKNVVYNFYLSHNPSYNQLSPVLLVLEGLYKYCQQHSVSLLDLGTSSLLGMPNFPLLDFKRRVGSEFSCKFAFHKALHA
jgi:hypothetical protein